MSIELTTVTTPIPLIFNSNQAPKPLPPYKKVLSVFYDAALGYIVATGLVNIYKAEERTANLLFYSLPYVCTRLINAAQSIFTSKPSNDTTDIDPIFGKVAGSMLAIAGTMGLTYMTKDVPSRSATMMVGFFSSTALEFAVNKVIEPCLYDDEPQHNFNLTRR